MFTPSGGCQRKKYCNISFDKELERQLKISFRLCFSFLFSCLSPLGLQYGFRKTASFLY